MEAQDLDEVDRLSQVSFEHPWTRQMLQSELEHDWSTILLAEQPAVHRQGPADGLSSGEPEGSQWAIVGFLVFWVVLGEVHILNIAVHPDSRRRGIARELLNAARKQAEAEGAEHMTLEVRRSNSAAISLYEKMGFRQVGIRPRYYEPDGEDAVLMSVALQGFSGL